MLPALAALALASAACSTPETQAYRLNEDGSLAYYQGDYGRALELFRQAQVIRPDLAELNLNAGAAMAKDGDRERSLRELRRVFSSEDPTLKSKAHYDIGTIHAQEQRENEAIEELKWALRLDASDQDAKHNLEVLLLRRQRREEELRRQQQQPQQQQPGQPEPGQPEDGTPPDQQGQPGTQGTTGESQPSGQNTPTPPNPQALSEALDRAGVELSIEDALRILDALRDRERQLQAELNRAGNRGQRVDKDW